MNKPISWPGWREYGVRTSMITETGGGAAPNTSPIITHVKSLPWVECFICCCWVGLHGQVKDIVIVGFECRRRYDPDSVKVRIYKRQ